MLHLWPLALTSCAECYVGLKRIEEFLLMAENRKQENLVGHHNLTYLKDIELNDINKMSEAAANRIQVNEQTRQTSVSFDKVCAFWSANDEATNTGLTNNIYVV